MLSFPGEKSRSPACLLQRKKSVYVIANILCVSAAAAVLFSEALLPGNDLSCLDGLHAYSPWKEMHGDAGIQNPLLGDVTSQFVPWEMFARRMLNSGSVPLWNPYNGCGEPFLANGQSAVFYPFSVAARCLPHPFLCKALLKLVCCQLGMFFFLRQFSLSWFSCLAGGLLFTFSGFTMVWLNHPHTNVSVLMPILFCLWLHALRTRRAVSFCGAAAVIAAQLLGGHPVSVVQSGLLLGCFSAAWVGVRSPGRLLKTLGALCCACALGVFLAGFQVFPLLGYLRESTALLLRPLVSGSDSAYFSFQIQDWEGLFGLLWPKIFGTPLDRNWCGPVNFNEIAGGFIGLGGLFCAMGFLQKKRETVIFAVLGLLCLVMAFKVPGVDLLLRIKALAGIDHKRMLMGAAFFLSALSACGIDTLLQGRGIGRGAYVLRVGLFSFCVTGAFAAQIALGARPLEQLHYSTVLTEQVLPAGIGFIVLVPLCLTRKYALRLCVLGAILAELLIFSWKYIPAAPVRTARIATPVLDALERDSTPYRAASLAPGYLFPNTNLFFPVPMVTGYDAVGKRAFFEFLASVTPFPPHPVFHTMHWKPPLSSAWLDFLNVKYIIAPRHASLAPPRFERVETDGSAFALYRNTCCLPRAFLVSQGHAPKASDAGSMLGSPAFNPRRDVLLYTQDSVQFSKDATDDDLCRIEHHAPGRVTLTAVHARPRILVFSEVWDAGWRAFVDDTEKKVLRANHAFMAVVLEKPGRHTVVFKYQPRSFYAGLVTSALSALALLVVAAAGRRRQ